MDLSVKKSSSLSASSSLYSSNSFRKSNNLCFSQYSQNKRKHDNAKITNCFTSRGDKYSHEKKTQGKHVKQKQHVDFAKFVVIFCDACSGQAFLIHISLVLVLCGERKSLQVVFTICLTKSSFRSIFNCAGKPPDM